MSQKQNRMPVMVEVETSQLGRVLAKAKNIGFQQDVAYGVVPSGRSSKACSIVRGTGANSKVERLRRIKGVAGVYPDIQFGTFGPEN